MSMEDWGLVALAALVLPLQLTHQQMLRRIDQG